MKKLVVLSALLLPIVAPVPALAQGAAPTAAQPARSSPGTPVITSSGAGDRVNQITVYGNDPCPPSDDGTIIVCGRLDEGERYRIPEALRGDPNNPRRESWASRVRSIETVGRFGTNSCTPSGLGGFTGCLNQVIDNAVAERAQARGVDWTTAVAAARAERMAGFDAASQQVEAQIAADEAARVARQNAQESDGTAHPAAGAATGAEPAGNPDAQPLPDPTTVRNPH